ncbi:MAG: DUF2878 domain-containing protein [Pelovirga sp.]
MNPLLNIAIYQLVWFIAVLGGEGLVWLGLLVLTAHFFLSPRPQSDLLLALVVLLIGVLVDGLLRQIGVFVFVEDRFPLPFWLMLIWVALATLLTHSLRWLAPRPWLAVVCGACGGPLAYVAGVRLGVAAFGVSTPAAIVLLAVVWGALVPLLLHLGGRLVVATDQPLLKRYGR